MSALSNKIGLVTGSGQGIGRAIALSFAREGAKSIRINAVSPGVILTPGLEQYFEEQPDKEDVLRQKSIMNRLGAPEEIADAVSFLSSDRASFITGQVLSVDGGGSVR